MTKRALFVGRFQPFHKGHLEVINSMIQSKEIDEIIIGIGSSQVKDTFYNPFSADEREMMIKALVDNLDKKIYIIKIDDINNYDSLVEHVEKLCPEFHIVYFGNAITNKLFEEKGYKIKKTTESGKTISGTEVRNLMIRGGNWKEYVPGKVIGVLEELGGESKIKEISTRYFKPNVCADIVVNYKGRGIILIQRGNEPFKDKWAFPGGHFDLNDYNLRECAIRELYEETGIKVEVEDLKLIKEYADFGRDPRGPTISIAYYVEISEGDIKAGDDAKNIQIFEEIPNDLAFDHNKMWDDCQEKYGLKEEGK